MTTSDDLKASGLLYGSNFHDWKLSIDAKLRMHGLELFATQARSPYNEEYSKAAWAEKSAEAANIIRVEVIPALLRRIPTGELKDAKRLMTRLEAIAIRFRFLDLPAELRNRVYEHLIDAEGSKKIYPREAQQEHYAPITQTSAQLRKESLPIMFARTTFHFSFLKSPSSLEPEISVSQALRAWSIKQVQTQLKLLRAVVITENFRKLASKDVRAKDIRLSFSKRNGFSATPEGVAFTRQARELFEDHMKAMESVRSMFSMQGEIIILALVSNPRLWKLNTLSVKSG